MKTKETSGHEEHLQISLNIKFVASAHAGLWCGHSIVYPIYLTRLGCSC